MNRRKLLKIALGSAASTTIVGKEVFASEGSLCSGVLVPTVPQTEGPFYPKDWKDYEADADMTTITGSGEYAKGQVVVLTGSVIDLDCKPVANATVDVWQANIFGQYFHERDSDFNDLKDKSFQYRCRVITDSKGKFSVKTIKPAAYPAGGGWVRPPHIHYKVEAKGFKTLTTQMYFQGDSLNDEDRILRSMTSLERDSVIVSFEENEQKILIGSFNIVVENI